MLSHSFIKLLLPIQQRRFQKNLYSQEMHRAVVLLRLLPPQTQAAPRLLHQARRPSFRHRHGKALDFQARLPIGADAICAPTVRPNSAPKYIHLEHYDQRVC